jgi:hypothetical protein
LLVSYIKQSFKTRFSFPSGSYGSILRTFAARHRERIVADSDPVPGPGHHRPEEEQVVHEEGRKGTRRTQDHSTGNHSNYLWFSLKRLCKI